MKAGIARYGRTFLAALTAAMMVLAVMFLLADTPAQASDHQIRICHALGNGGYTAPIPTKQQIFDPDGHGSFVAGVHPDDIVPPFEAGSQGSNSWDAYPGKNWDAEGQAIWNNDCSEPSTTEPPTTEPPTTEPPTTAPPTTVPEETTTTAAEETTTTSSAIDATTTTTTIPDEVRASIVVTVSGTCELDGDTGSGIITVGISVDDGAVVVVRDGNGAVVGSRSTSGTISVDEGASYTWEATPNEGFEFPAGSDTSGTIVIDTCSNAGTLPFTGVDSDQMAMLAASLAAAGAVLLLVGRSRGDEA